MKRRKVKRQMKPKPIVVVEVVMLLTVCQNITTLTLQNVPYENLTKQRKHGNENNKRRQSYLLLLAPQGVTLRIP